MSQPPSEVASFAVTEVRLAGTQLVEASAGTGKTWSIATLFVRLLVEGAAGGGPVPVDELLVVTFTRAATQELRERLRARAGEAHAAFAAAARGAALPERTDDTLRALVARCSGLEAAAERLEKALQSFDQAAIFTIHSFAQRLLVEHGFEAGAPTGFTLAADTSAIDAAFAHDFWARESWAAPEPLVAAWREGGLGPDALGGLRKLAESEAVIRPVPEDAPPASQDAARLAEAAAAVQAAFATLREAWAAEADALWAWLEHPGSIHGQKLNSTSRAKLREEVGAWLAAGPGATPPKVLDRLTSGYLATIAKAPGPIPAAGLQAAAEAYLAAAAREGAAKNGAFESLRLRFLAHVRAQGRAARLEAGVLGFNDLLHIASEALREGRDSPLAARIRGRYRAALIDEFQDTDSTQWRLFDAAFGGREDRAFLLVGDPKQAIYGFRGADLATYLRARAGVPAHARHTMTVNHRSDPSVLRGVEALFRKGTAPFGLPGVEFISVTPGPTATDCLFIGGDCHSGLGFVFVPREGRTGRQGKAIVDGPGVAAEVTAHRVTAWLRAGATIHPPKAPPRPLQAGDIAVLVRTNAQASAVQAALRAAGVPSVRHTDESVLNSAAALALAELLGALAAPGQLGPVQLAEAGPLLGGDAAGLAAILADDVLLEARLAQWRRWGALWAEQGVVAALRAVFAERGVLARLLARPDGERLTIDLLHLVEVVHAAAAARPAADPPALLRWFAEVRQGARAEEVRDASRLRLESDALAVQIVTLHRSKGLEYPIVLLPTGWHPEAPHDGEPPRFHDPAPLGALTVDFTHPPPDATKDAAATEATQEGMRLLYVGLTRARHRVEVLYGGFRHAEQSPLAHLIHGSPPAAPIDDAPLRAALAALCETAGGAITCTDAPPPGAPAPLAALAHSTAAVAARVPTRPGGVLASVSTSSFSRLAQGADESTTAAAAAADRARDHDEAIAPADGVGAPAAAPVPLHAFGRGPTAGNLLHEILEHTDFPNAGEPAFREAVLATLRRYGEAEAWADSLTTGLRAVIDTPLGPGGPRLADLPRAATLREMEFLLPVEGAPRLTAAGLAAALRAAPSPGMPADYPDRVARLPFAAWRGWLRGFVDLIYLHEGRFYVVDHKSNHLGPHAADYGVAALTGAMVHHHYILQYHLYALALHRHLRARLPGYTPALHWGGVRYLFLRGMSPAHPPGCGVFSARPSEALLDALDAAFGGAGAPA